MNTTAIKIFLIISSFVLHFSSADAQMTDSLATKVHKGRNTVLKQFAIPTVLIGLGIYGTTDNSFINHNEIKEERDEYFPGFSNRADNYLQFAPIPVVYAMDAMGLKGEHNWQQQTKYLGGAQLMMMAFVFPIKKYTHILRPDGSAYNSFPSGHTAQAFLAATFFQKEYGKKYPWVSAGMFTLASGIGVFRILNNRHWVSDVLAGAGLGMLSVELSYLLLKSKSKHAKALPDMVMPSYKNGVLNCTAFYNL